MAYAIPRIPPLSELATKNGNGRSRSGSISSIQSPRSPASPYDPLLSALSTAQARYTIANAQSLKAHNEACFDMPGGNTRTTLYSSPFPITFASGKGAELTSLDGDVFVDFLGEFTAGIYGHSNKVIAEAVADAMIRGWNYGGPNIYERKLARKVTERFSPSGVELVRFTNSGTESNTMALATALAFTGRKKVLVFNNAYHGGTLSFPPSLSEINVNLPHEFIMAPYNDIQGTHSILSKLPQDTLAAIIVEPVQGSGGCIVGKKDFLQYLDTTAHALGALFIVDEVMTSRLSYHGLSAELELKPDLVTLGKWIGGGMTFGAFGGKKDGPMTMFDPRGGVLSHAGTFNNNVITMAAGSAGIDIYNDHEVQRLNALGENLKDGIEKTLARYKARPRSKSSARSVNIELGSLSMKPLPELPTKEISLDSLSLEDEQDSRSNMWVTGKGSMLSIHFSGANEKNLLALLWHHMLDHEIYIAQRGFIALTMELTEKHVEKFIAALDGFVGRYQQALNL